MLFNRLPIFAVVFAACTSSSPTALDSRCDEAIAKLDSCSIEDADIGECHAEVVGQILSESCETLADNSKWRDYSRLHVWQPTLNPAEPTQVYTFLRSRGVEYYHRTGAPVSFGSPDCQYRETSAPMAGGNTLTTITFARPAACTMQFIHYDETQGIDVWYRHF